MKKIYRVDKQTVYLAGTTRGRRRPPRCDDERHRRRDRQRHRRRVRRTAAAGVPRGHGRRARLGRVPVARLPDVLGGVRGGAGRQRAGVLRGHVLLADALGHQPVHHEHGRRRPAHDGVLRPVLVRRHAAAAVLAVRQRPLSHRQLRASRRRPGQRVHVGGDQRRPVHSDHVAVEAEGQQTPHEVHHSVGLDGGRDDRFSHSSGHHARSAVKLAQEVRPLHLHRNVVERERPAFLQRGAAGAPVLHTVCRSVVHVHQHRRGGVGQEDAGRGGELQRRADGQVQKKNDKNDGHRGHSVHGLLAALQYSFDTVGPRAVAELVEQPAVRVVPVPLAGHVAHVLQPADLLLDEHAVPDRFRDRAAQRARLRPVAGRVPAGPAAPAALQPQRPQPGGGPAPDQHDHVVRLGAPAQVVQRAARRVRPQLPQLARGDALNPRRRVATGHATRCFYCNQCCARYLDKCIEVHFSVISNLI